MLETISIPFLDTLGSLESRFNDVFIFDRLIYKIYITAIVRSIDELKR